jgi:hypothetical protein
MKARSQCGRRWGRLASGFAFSPGGALAAAWYNEALDERLSGKRWMEDDHRAGGWTPDLSLFRIEGRFTREIFREIAVALGWRKATGAMTPGWRGTTSMTSGRFLWACRPSTIMRRMRHTAAGCGSPAARGG